MKTLIETLKAKSIPLVRGLWCHRASYAALAALYGAGCLGWVDKDTVAQMATALYVALTTQRH